MIPLKLYRCNEIDLPQQVENGAIYLTPDTEKLYLDTDTERICINGGDMFKSVYDPNDDGVVTYAGTSYSLDGLSKQDILDMTAVDSALSDQSERPVQNKIVTGAINQLTAAMPKVTAKTVQEWAQQTGYVPANEEIIIYTNYESVVENNETVLVPNIKIGDGSTYVQDLPFIDKVLRQTLIDHVNDTAAHVTAADKLFWNNKLNVNDLEEVVDESLILNRN